jgi:hypothetical protein
LRLWLTAATAIAAVLVFVGLATTPGLTTNRGAIGASAVLLVLGGYVLIGRMAAPWATPREPLALSWAKRFGLVAAAVYTAEVVLEYVLTPVDNTTWGIVEFALVFLAYAAAGATVAWRTGRWRPAVLSGVFAAMGAAIVWYVVVLAVFYLFRGSARQAAVLRAEGDFEDFRRSGEASLQVFLIEDFLGAGFFHLLLSPLIGAILGSIGGLLGLAARRMAGSRAA